ncbi:TIGR02266 family protein [Stigmatella sp. ncwal1]|uniref:TIGR02266 family protein n=1 Tax=Stigmatella ashevillensis TaxID=2995309 RepID=A0ABT5D3H4_9BACT|nr:TIGR02266 family protein [Stigmatella ashevillena]MDC0708225.1 TIGR02266 family protein [Stigmatella ashevillena]
MNTDLVDAPDLDDDDFRNRRAEERIPARFEVRFAQTKDAAKALRAYSLNISAGGLCLRTQKAYDVGSPVSVEMLIDGEAFQLQGVVAWVRDEEEAIGVRFTDVSEGDRLRLQRVVQNIKR